MIDFFKFSATVYSVYIVYNFETSIRLRQKLNHWNQWKQHFGSVSNYENKRSPNILNQVITDFY